MSYFTEITAQNSLQPEIGILSATGLSRELLASLFRENGLFGSESDLSPVEQAVVQSQLGTVPGLRNRPLLAPTDARLAALARYTEAAMRAGGRLGSADEAQLVAAGYRPQAASEVLRVVRNVRDVFGLVPAPRHADVRLGTVDSRRVARAA